MLPSSFWGRAYCGAASSRIVRPHNKYAFGFFAHTQMPPAACPCISAKSTPFRQFYGKSISRGRGDRARAKSDENLTRIIVSLGRLLFSVLVCNIIKSLANRFHALSILRYAFSPTVGDKRLIRWLRVLEIILASTKAVIVIRCFS